ncbi:MAG: methyltransferase domain-containing protein [Ilumatobacteraceae bacterium]
MQFPVAESDHLDQDETYFYLFEDGQQTRLRFHDYGAIYDRPGLYEQLFNDRLKCESPSKVASILQSAVTQAGEVSSRLRVLDLGAGNGIMGEELRRLGVARLLGADIIPEAANACFRDRPSLYDDYLVCDLATIDDETAEELRSWSLDCLTTVAALGFGDIPPLAFVNAFNLIRPDGWVAFNIKQSFLDRSETAEPSPTIRELVFTDYLEIHHLERYRHRLSIEGDPIFYYAIAGRKVADVPRGLFPA